MHVQVVLLRPPPASILLALPFFHAIERVHLTS